MNYLKKILCFSITLALVGVLVTSCEREVIIEDDVEEVKTTILNDEHKLKQMYESYIKQHGEPEIEYMSLEELNKFNIANSLPTVTLEELGITKKELVSAQTAIKNGLKPRASCWFSYLGDMDNNGEINYTDIDLARRVILGIDASNQNSYNFGFFSYYCKGHSWYLSTYDLVLVQKMILGISDCC